MARSLDSCPHCGTRVVQVTTGESATGGSSSGVVRPCGHRVLVTLWPDRVQLDAA